MVYASHTSVLGLGQPVPNCDITFTTLLLAHNVAMSGPSLCSAQATNLSRMAQAMADMQSEWEGLEKQSKRLKTQQDDLKQRMKSTLNVGNRAMTVAGRASHGVTLLCWQCL